MAIIRVKKTNDYTVMSNYHFKDKKLSLKAKGLLSLMLSLPDNWDYTIAGLVSICKENETAIKSTLEELKELGYLEIIKKMPNETESGRIEYEYNVFEKPKQEGKKQEVENLGVEFQGVENQGQLNTNNQILNNQIYTSSNDDEPSKDELLVKDFEKIWIEYPRKEGKSQAFKKYKTWLKGKKYLGKTVKLTNEQMWYAVQKYSNLLKEKNTAYEYIKHGDTFFGDSIMEYAEGDS